MDEGKDNQLDHQREKPQSIFAAKSFLYSAFHELYIVLLLDHDGLGTTATIEAHEFIEQMRYGLDVVRDQHGKISPTQITCLASMVEDSQKQAVFEAVANYQQLAEMLVSPTKSSFTQLEWDEKEYLEGLTPNELHGVAIGQIYEALFEEMGS